MRTLSTGHSTPVTVAVEPKPKVQPQGTKLHILSLHRKFSLPTTTQTRPAFTSGKTDPHNAESIGTSCDPNSPVLLLKHD